MFLYSILFLTQYSCIFPPEEKATSLHFDFFAESNTDSVPVVFPEILVVTTKACETPVIACKPGATEEVIIHGETGFLIDEDDEANLIRYVEKFLNEPSLCTTMGEKLELE